MVLGGSGCLYLCYRTRSSLTPTRKSQDKYGVWNIHSIRLSIIYPISWHEDVGYWTTWRIATFNGWNWSVSDDIVWKSRYRYVHCIIFHNTTVQKEIFMGIGSIQKITFRKFCFFEKGIWCKLERKWKKTKNFWACRNGETERSGSESCRIQSQDGQELGSPTAATTHIAQTIGVTQSVDLTNKGMGNHYLRDVHGCHTAVCVRGQYLWHTSPTRHLKVQNSEDTYEDVCSTQKHNEFERQPSLSGLVQDTVRAHFVCPLWRLRSWSSSNHHEVLWRSPARHCLCRSSPRNAR